MSGVATSYMDGKGSSVSCCMQSSHILTKVSWNCVIKESGAPQLHTWFLFIKFGRASTKNCSRDPRRYPSTCFARENALWRYRARLNGFGQVW